MKRAERTSASDAPVGDSRGWCRRVRQGMPRKRTDPRDSRARNPKCQKFRHSHRRIGGRRTARLPAKQKRAETCQLNMCTAGTMGTSRQLTVKEPSRLVHSPPGCQRPQMYLVLSGPPDFVRSLRFSKFDCFELLMSLSGNCLGRFSRIRDSI